MCEKVATGRTTVTLRLGAQLCLALALSLGAVSTFAQEPKEPDAGTTPALSAFDIPRILDGERAAAALAQIGELTQAETALNALIERYPSLAVLHYDLAVLQLRQDRKGEAIQSLARAVAAGLPRVVLEGNPAFQPLRADPAFQQLIYTAKPETPSAQTPVESKPVELTLADNGVALVSTTNTAWDPRIGMLRSFFRFPDKGRQGSAVANSGLGAEQLNAWFLQGTAAGNYGDLYDNRDGGHSALPPQDFPQLTRVHYSEEAREAGLDRSLDRYVLFNAVTIGNASLALTGGPMWRSLPREALSDPMQVGSLFQQYAANHIYVYPAHQDYGRERGDLITANTPYMLISVGSSGSDQPLLKAVAAILAAFRPEVKTFLIKNGLISPTVQWIFRRGQIGIDNDDDYLTGRAHPSAFDGKRLNPLDMIERAHSLEAADVPPMVRFRVKEESRGEAGTDTMLPSNDEALFDTPSAIARVVRSTAYTRRLVIDASETADPNGRALTFHWSVLRGDKKRITVHLLNKAGSVAEIIIPWDAGAQPVGQPNITGDRVEIGVFANNGKNWSAPAFISLLYPANEKRTYRSDGKIAEVDYDDPRYQERYVDPVLFPVREWRDSYIYDKSGRLLGWTRSRGNAISRFTRDGARVVDSDHLGRPLKAERVRYQFTRQPDGRLEVREVVTGTFVTYSYIDDNDFLGIPIQSSGG